MKINDNTDNFDLEQDLVPIKTESDYFKKLGSSIPQNMRYSYSYKRNRNYEAQTLLFNFGIPNLFVTVRLDTYDQEGREVIMKSFKIGNQQVNSLKNNAIEYSLYFNRKIQFIRSHLKQKSICNIFGKVAAYCDTIEYTSSGIPHLHALLWLSDEYKHLASIENNKFVSTKRTNPRDVVDQELNNLIEKYQIHTCLREKGNTKRNGEIVNYCLNDYPFDVNDNDRIDEVNTRIYYKRGINDEYVIPYNPELLMMGSETQMFRFAHLTLLLFIFAST